MRARAWPLFLGCTLACGASVPGPGLDAGGTDAGSDAGTDAGGLVAVPLAVCVPRAYTAPVFIGGAGPFQLLVDTGSATLAVAGQGCAECAAAGASRLYDPGSSAVDEDAGASAMYGALAPSGWTGDVWEDTVAIGTPAASARVRLVDIQQETSFLVGHCGPAGATPDGVVGFQPSASATTGTNAFVDQLAATGALPDVFATRLCSSGGTLWLGGYDPVFASGAPQYTPMFPSYFSAYVYTVDLESIAIDGGSIPVPSGVYTATLLDTGSDITSVPPAVFDALISRLTSDSSFVQVFGANAATFFTNPNACVSLSQTAAELDAALPPLTLQLGTSPGISVTAPATQSYLQTPGGGQWCPAITSRAPSPNFQSIAAILGGPLLGANIVVFDRVHQRVGFVPQVACP
jgi:hypothetical protein